MWSMDTSLSIEPLLQVNQASYGKNGLRGTQKGAGAAHLSSMWIPRHFLAAEGLVGEVGDGWTDDEERCQTGEAQQDNGAACVEERAGHEDHTDSEHYTPDGRSVCAVDGDATYSDGHGAEGGQEASDDYANEHGFFGFGQ